MASTPCCDSSIQLKPCARKCHYNCTWCLRFVIAFLAKKMNRPKDARLYIKVHIEQSSRLRYGSRSSVLEGQYDPALEPHILACSRKRILPLLIPCPLTQCSSDLTCLVFIPGFLILSHTFIFTFATNEIHHGSQRYNYPSFRCLPHCHQHVATRR